MSLIGTHACTVDETTENLRTCVLRSHDPEDDEIRGESDGIQARCHDFEQREILREDSVRKACGDSKQQHKQPDLPCCRYEIGTRDCYACLR
jgi:hypothetical protein